MELDKESSLDESRAHCSLPETNNPQHLSMLRVGIWWERRDSNSGPTD